MNHETLNEYIARSLFKWFDDNLDDLKTSELLNFVIGFPGIREDILNPVAWLHPMKPNPTEVWHGSGAGNRIAKSAWALGYTFGNRDGKTTAEDAKLNRCLKGRLQDLIEGDVENQKVGAKLYSWNQTTNEIIEQIGFMSLTFEFANISEPEGAVSAVRYTGEFIFSVEATF